MLPASKGDCEMKWNPCSGYGQCRGRWKIVQCIDQCWDQAERARCTPPQLASRISSHKTRAQHSTAGIIAIEAAGKSLARPVAPATSR